MQSEVTTEPINRGQFLRSLGLSSGALMALYCMGTLTSCSSSNEPATVTPAPTPGAGTGLTGNLDPTKGVVDFTIDLNNTTYSKLKTEGEFVQLGQIVVANAQGTLVALSNVCTHQGGQLSYRKANNDFQCNVHAGLFTTTGAVKQSPPTAPVKAYKATRTGDSLRIVA
ncbi:Rieske 2Fe-2S domain-containing protein [Rudanella paleaurantiibacter]|uniref:Rieske 2Fe-2S domain-containing protein n=1 Tax=Rudanella paleaurantiibacter TaxID=2614655 RepID=A0A7J5U4G9_9BACT|nr:Rieske 2Fe-2S domain-containing protein [Rudanella paleaurantiibacter]KAB7732621.1 Rieske 2Fe-2S domain-containing protein [Rudanella paleaurantiibacter]